MILKRFECRSPLLEIFLGLIRLRYTRHKFPSCWKRSREFRQLLIHSLWVLIRFPTGIWVLDFRIFKYNGLLVGSLSVHPWRNLYSLHWESSRIFLCQVKSVHQVFTRYTGKNSWQKWNSQRKTVLNTFYFNFNQRVIL